MNCGGYPKTVQDHAFFLPLGPHVCMLRQSGVAVFSRSEGLSLSPACLSAPLSSPLSPPPALPIIDAKDKDSLMTQNCCSFLFIVTNFQITVNWTHNGRAREASNCIKSH